MSEIESRSVSRDMPNFAKQLVSGYSVTDVDAYFHQAMKEFDSQRSELTQMQAEKERAAAELSAALRQVEELRAQQRADRHLLQVLTDRVDELNAQLGKQPTESQTVDEILRAAHTAAQQLKADSQKESENMLRLAEARVERVIAEMRQRGQELQAEYDMTRKEYCEFLSKVRALAQAMIRQVDQHDSPI